jgi:hypothetical protein
MLSSRRQQVHYSRLRYSFSLYSLKLIRTPFFVQFLIFNLINTIKKKVLRSITNEVLRSITNEVLQSITNDNTIMDQVFLGFGNNILDLFTQGNGTYDKNLQFELILLAVGLVVFFNYYFTNNYGFVIILLAFVIYIASMWLKVRRTASFDFNKVTLYKLRRIQKSVNDVVEIKIRQIRKTSSGNISRRELRRLYASNKLESLYIDANMIHFIDSLSPLQEYNPSEYVLFVKGVNGILRIRREIEDFLEANGEGSYPVNITEMFGSAIELKKKTTNNLHNFIYSVPKTNVMYRYIDDILDRYNVLITRNLDIMDRYYKDNINRQGINNRTRFITYDTTKDYDALDNHPVTPQKHHGDMLAFYL